MSSLETPTDKQNFRRIFSPSWKSSNVTQTMLFWENSTSESFGIYCRKCWTSSMVIMSQSKSMSAWAICVGSRLINANMIPRMHESWAINERAMAYASFFFPRTYADSSHCVCMTHEWCHCALFLSSWKRILSPTIVMRDDLLISA